MHQNLSEKNSFVQNSEWFKKRIFTTTSYNICICDRYECQNHSKLIKIYMKSVLFKSRCILV